MPTAGNSVLRLLPSIDELLRTPAMDALARQKGRAPVLDAAREALQQLRTEIASGDVDQAQITARVDGLPLRVEQQLQRTIAHSRSEERRVGKECIYRLSTY